MEWEKGREKQEEKKEGRREWDKERIMNSRGWGGGGKIETNRDTVQEFFYILTWPSCVIA